MQNNERNIFMANKSEQPSALDLYTNWHLEHKREGC